MVALHLEILPPAQARLWPQLKQIPSEFVLYRGTALALHLCHRFSVDFDFFSAASFNPEALQQELPLASQADVLQKTANTLTIRTCDNVRFSFFWRAQSRPD